LAFSEWLSPTLLLGTVHLDRRIRCAQLLPTIPGQLNAALKTSMP
jgi:hypothetical protein